jgi:hypothetical protein
MIFHCRLRSRLKLRVMEGCKNVVVLAEVRRKQDEGVGASQHDSATSLQGPVKSDQDPLRGSICYVFPSKAIDQYSDKLGEREYQQYFSSYVMDSYLPTMYKVRASGAVQYIEISVHWTEPTCTTHDRQVKWTSTVFIPDVDGNSRPTPSFTTRFQNGMRQAPFSHQCKVTDLICQSRLLGCILS